jgi:hypothetical protein
MSSIIFCCSGNCGSFRIGINSPNRRPRTIILQPNHPERGERAEIGIFNVFSTRAAERVWRPSPSPRPPSAPSRGAEGEGRLRRESHSSHDPRCPHRCAPRSRSHARARTGRGGFLARPPGVLLRRTGVRLVGVAPITCPPTSFRSLCRSGRENMRQVGNLPPLLTPTVSAATAGQTHTLSGLTGNALQPIFQIGVQLA